MVEVFKTNIQTKIRGRQLLAILSAALPCCKINVDLSDQDKILRVEGEKVEVNKVLMLVKEMGIFCERLN